MSSEDTKRLMARLLISFLTKQWKGRTHAGLADRVDLLSKEDVEAEVERFIKYLGEI